MSTLPFHKHDERDDLLALASDVYVSPASETAKDLTARDVARLLVGPIGWVTSKVGVDGMQERVAKLVRHAPLWSSGMGQMPLEVDGKVDELTALIAVCASGLYQLVGADKLKSAMAFWATERDASVWQQIAA